MRDPVSPVIPGDHDPAEPVIGDQFLAEGEWRGLSEDRAAMLRAAATLVEGERHEIVLTALHAGPFGKMLAEAAEDATDMLHLSRSRLARFRHADPGSVLGEPDPVGGFRLASTASIAALFLLPRQRLR
jgi:hypothetical protein